ncbi:DNA-binding protein [Marmoricola endophyticus]|uniref:DNA-binding protein n=1 Tax=Marmoricola endophyticus TaxID=2040280 RepID=A0A917F0X2_9ACTN|nr:ComEA family DNA-binding protein [Marmoricola endophyticus]GGF37381.1 DNA-binding protein [Marmoricola endophyticus]
MGRSRRRERDQVAAVARRRMALLEAELAGLRDEAGDAGPTDSERGDTAGRTLREPGQHRQQPRPAAQRERPPLRAGRPGMLEEDRGWSQRPAFGPSTSWAGEERAGESGYAYETAPLRVDPLRGDERDVRRGVLDVEDETEPAPAGATAWLADRLPETLRGRVALSGRAVAALVVVAVLAVGIVGWTSLRSGDGDPVPAARVQAPASASPAALASGAPTTAAAAPGTAASAAPTAAGGSVVVDVAGRVRRPGIVTLPAGSRVHEAIERAGGPRVGVSLTSLNLARVLVDGEQILVGVKGAAGAPTAGSGSPSGSTTGSGSGQLVNLNTADAAALDTLPGVGEVTAQKIIDYRTSHGGFTSVDQLLDVDGIGEKTLADIKPGVTV